MVKRKYPFFLLILLFAGTLTAFLLLPTEEKRVKRRFALLSKNLTKSVGEDAFMMLRKVKGIGGLFGEGCYFIVPDYPLSGTYTREEISRLALQARAHFSDVTLKFYDMKVYFPEKNSARVNLTARLTGNSVGGERVDETRELLCLLKKQEKDWLFQSIEVIEVLRK